MWIQRTEENAQTEAIRMGDMTEQVSFNENGNARVTEHNGRILIDAGVAVERENSDEDTTSDEDETEWSATDYGAAEGEAESTDEETETE